MVSATQERERRAARQFRDHAAGNSLARYRRRPECCGNAEGGPIGKVTSERLYDAEIGQGARPPMWWRPANRGESGAIRTWSRVGARSTRQRFLGPQTLF